MPIMEISESNPGALAVSESSGPSLTVSELAVSQLHGVPSAVWIVKKHAHDEFDAYIVVSFVNATLVLSIGDTVEEVSDSGFLDTTPSLAVSLLGDDSLMQVHPSGIRHIKANGRINEWKTPGRKTIVKVGFNRTQVAIALGGGKLIYFELDTSGQLMEVEKLDRTRDVACLDIAPMPEGSPWSRFLAVGSYNSKIQILSLDPDNYMRTLITQTLTLPPESLLFLEVQALIGGEDGADHPAKVFLNAGLQTGYLHRTKVDMVTGELSNTRTCYLGPRAPKLFFAKVRGRRAMLCLSSRPWLGYIYQGHFSLTPLSYETLNETLEYVASFSSDQSAEDVVAVGGDALRVFIVERPEETARAVEPLQFIFHPERIDVVVQNSQDVSAEAPQRAHRRYCNWLYGDQWEDGWRFYLVWFLYVLGGIIGFLWSLDYQLHGGRNLNMHAPPWLNE